MPKFKLLAATSLAALTLSACSVSFSTANIQNVYICPDPSEQRCESNVSNIESGATELFATVSLANAPEGTQVRGEWWQKEPDTEINKLTYTTKDGENEVSFSISAPDGVPAGNYEFRAYLNESEEPVVQPFSVQ